MANYMVSLATAVYGDQASKVNGNRKGSRMGQRGTVMKHTDLKITGIGNCHLIKVYIMLRNLFNIFMIQKMEKN